MAREWVYLIVGFLSMSGIAGQTGNFLEMRAVGQNQFLQIFATFDEYEKMHFCGNLARHLWKIVFAMRFHKLVP